jgi:hypothetical protein
MEHCVCTAGGGKHWAVFATSYFKKAQARVRLVELIGYFTRNAVERVPDFRPGARRISELPTELSITSSSAASTARDDTCPHTGGGDVLPRGGTPLPEH